MKEYNEAVKNGNAHRATEKVKLIRYISMDQGLKYIKLLMDSKSEKGTKCVKELRDACKKEFYNKKTSKIIVQII